MIIPNRSNVVKNEQKILKNFFGRDFFDIPNLPDWITDEFIQYWNKNIFHIRYLPPVLFGKNLNLPLWQDKPSKFF